jgi:hypothetical protein
MNMMFVEFVKRDAAKIPELRRAIRRRTGYWWRRSGCEGVRSRQEKSSLRHKTWFQTRLTS